MIVLTNIYGYIDCMYVANYVMETEGKDDTVFISKILSDWQFSQSEGMLEMKAVSSLLSVCMK